MPRSEPVLSPGVGLGKIQGLWASDSVSAAVCEPLLQVAELKSKLDSAERFLGTLEKERLQSPRESYPTRRWTSEPLWLAEVGGARERIPAPDGPGCTGYPRAQTRGQVSRIRRQEASYSLLPLLFSRLHPQEEPSHRFGGVFLGHCSLGKNSFCFFAFTHIDLFLLLLLIIWQIFVQLLFSLQEALQISMTFVTLKR